VPRMVVVWHDADSAGQKRNVAKVSRGRTRHRNDAAYTLTCSFPLKLLKTEVPKEARVSMNVILKECSRKSGGGSEGHQEMDSTATTLEGDSPSLNQYLNLPPNRRIAFKRKQSSLDVSLQLQFSEALLEDFSKDTYFVLLFNMYLDGNITGTNEEEEEAILEESLDTAAQRVSLLSIQSTPFQCCAAPKRDSASTEQGNTTTNADNKTPTLTISQAKALKDQVHTIATTTHTNPTIHTYNEILDKLMELYRHLTPSEKERAKEEAREVFLPIQSQTQANELASSTAHSDTTSAISATPLSANFGMDPFAGQMEDISGQGDGGEMEGFYGGFSPSHKTHS